MRAIDMTTQGGGIRALRRGFGAVLVLGLLAGCGGVPADQHDRAIAKDRADFKALTEPPEPEPESERDRTGPDAAPAFEAPAPELAPIDAAPEEPDLFPNPRVSVTVSEEVPVKDVLFQLSQDAGVDVEIDPRITGSIILTARDTPFLDVVRRIARRAGLSYDVVDNVVHVDLDRPFQRTYAIPYITQVRETRSEVAISTALDTPGVDSGVSGDSSSRSQVTGESTFDLFAGLDAALRSIIRNTAPHVDLPDDRADGANGEEDAVTLLPQAGMVSVFGTRRQHEAVQRYLAEVRRAVSAQVLIEGKVIEVNLNRRFESGVDWSAVGDRLAGGVDFNQLPVAGATAAGSGVASFAVDGGDFDLLLNLLSEFGTTRTLSSPRLTVMNNQTAILKVAENEVFFDLDVQDREEVIDGQLIRRLTVGSTIRSVPVGLVMAVQPAINLRDDRVVMTLRPTVTRVDRFVDDPAVAFLGNVQDVRSQVPVVETREVDSVLELESGQAAVLGGLMQERTTNRDTGVPGLSRIPWLGRAFKQREETTDMVELVLLLRARILHSAPDPADRRLQRDFVRDPRPFPDGTGGGDGAVQVR